MKYFFILVFQLSTTTAWGEVTSLEQLLFEIKAKALQINMSKNQKKSDSILVNKRGIVFATKGFAEASYSKQNNPQTSPFSTSENTNTQYGLGVNKLWTSGINSELSYTLSDVSNSFYSGQSNAFLTPTLQLRLSSKIFQDLIHQKYGHLNKEISSSLETIGLNSKIEQKGILTGGLLALSSLLERKENLFLQKSLCDKNKVQSNKLSQRKKRQLISNREYFLSLRETVVCEAVVEDLTKKLYEAKKGFESTYNISANILDRVNSDLIFGDFEKKYDEYVIKKNVEGLVESKDEIKYLGSLLDTAKSKQNRLEAASKTNLSLEVRVGATGLDPLLSDSHQDLGDLRFPFIYMGLRMDLPFSDREALAEASSNSYQIRVIEAQKKLTIGQKKERLETLIETLKVDFSIYKKYIKSSKISKKVISEARKDFNNGRIDFFTLTEFNKNLIQDQKTLSAYRIQLLVRMVEYLDFYNYFDRYLEDLR